MGNEKAPRPHWLAPVANVQLGSNPLGARLTAALSLSRFSDQHTDADISRVTIAWPSGRLWSRGNEC